MKKVIIATLLIGSVIGAASGHYFSIGWAWTDSLSVIGGAIMMSLMVFSHNFSLPSQQE